MGRLAELRDSTFNTATAYLSERHLAPPVLALTQMSITPPPSGPHTRRVASHGVYFTERVALAADNTQTVRHIERTVDTDVQRAGSCGAMPREGAKPDCATCHALVWPMG